MEFYPSEKKQRLTLAQAIVRFLQVQYSEYDGQQERFIQGLWGIFGHGNVSGLSQALVEYGHDLPYHQPRNEQSMVARVDRVPREQSDARRRWRARRRSDPARPT